MEDITVEGRDMAAESSAAEASPLVRAKLDAVRSGRCLRPEDGACWRCEWYPWPSGCGPRVSVNHPRLKSEAWGKCPKPRVD